MRHMTTEMSDLFAEMKDSVTEKKLNNGHSLTEKSENNPGVIPKECLEHILHCASLAPSADNNQPWRFHVSGSGIDIYLATERPIKSDTEHILDYTAIGMVVENIRLACEYYNIAPSITINKIELNPASPLVSIRFQNGEKIDPNYHYIPLRHTDRGLNSKQETSNTHNFHFESAVLGDPTCLTPESLMEIRNLTRKSPWASLLQAALAWLGIVLVVMAAEYFHTIFITAFAVIFVATRQNIFALLIHEQAHQNVFKQGIGDLIINLVAGYPLLMTNVEDYAKVHLGHHAKYFTKEDPDFKRKSGENWALPLTRKKLLKLFLRDLFGLSFLAFFKGKRVGEKSTLTNTYRRRNPTPASVRVVFNVLLIVVLTVTHTWTIFLLYWVLPLITVFQVIVRWGALCEHQYNLEGVNVIETTPLLIPNRLERLILPNLNFGYHAYHHFFPSVPFSKLPQVHEIFMRENLVNTKHVFYSHIQYFKVLTK